MAAKLLAEYGSAGNRTKRYGYLPSDFAPAEVEDANGIYAAHSGHLQTPMLMTDSAETVVWATTMQAFGEAVIDEDPDADTTNVTLNIRFPGQYSDMESGLYQNNLRDYDPTTGRYIESDPIGLAGGMNLYDYAGQDPIESFDPSGELPIIPIIIGGA